MNVASLELCKELHELSGWSLPIYSPLKWVEYADDSCALWAGSDPEHWDEIIQSSPAYDLGYLMRKLQSGDLTVIMRFNRDFGGRIGMSSWDGKWCIGTFDMAQGEYPVADSPEDAAAKLAIALFKRGVLVKDPA